MCFHTFSVRISFYFISRLLCHLYKCCFQWQQNGPCIFIFIIVLRRKCFRQSFNGMILLQRISYEFCEFLYEVLVHSAFISGNLQFEIWCNWDWARYYVSNILSDYQKVILGGLAGPILAFLLLHKSYSLSTSLEKKMGWAIELYIWDCMCGIIVCLLQIFLLEMSKLCTNFIFMFFS